VKANFLFVFRVTGFAVDGGSVATVVAFASVVCACTCVARHTSTSTDKPKYIMLCSNLIAGVLVVFLARRKRRVACVATNLVVAADSERLAVVVAIARCAARCWPV
jgi:divalent metal cation (Fe/Co/Zn/Cd) transporter